MIEFYPQIKYVHIMAIMASGLLFVIRGSTLLAGMRWPLSAPARYLSYTIDSVLLTAAMMLLTILPGALYANGWLATKMVLLVMYVTFGMLAFRPKRTKRARILCFIAALLIYTQMYFIARSHHPLGALYLWLG